MTETTIPRHFVPQNLDAADLSALESLFTSLRLRSIGDVCELETWLRDESELLSALAAETARRYIAMTCHTDDAQAKERYLQMERDISPKIKVWADQLDAKFLDCDALAGLSDRYGRLIKKRRAAKEVFRSENTELQTTESELQTRQQSIMGGLSVEFEGKEHTLQQMAPYFQDQDQERRRNAWLASLDTRRSTWPLLNDLFDNLVGLRQRMATNADFDSYTAFRFKELQRFDYGPELCEEFHAAVEATVVPAVQRLNEQRRKALGVDQLAPYDLDVDLEGRAPFRPFETEDELVQLTRQLFDAVDPRFAADFDILREQKLLDLMSRKGKAPGGYQYSIEDIRLPFIFCNSVGTHQDVQTLLHEGGHAFHSILSRDEDLLTYRDAPIEFAETASMSMELMGLERLACVYGTEEAARTRRKHLEGILRILPWIASIDAFQHWIYGNAGHTQDQRQAAWLAIMDRFETGIDYDGVEDARANRWMAQGHLFQHPFYYIEYGIAQLASLQIWRAYRNDPAAAVANYRAGLALGGSRPLPELMQTAGAKFNVSEGMFQELVTDLEEQIGAP